MGSQMRRDATRASTDARAARTRSRLEAGLDEALRDGDDPSVAAVCGRARVARSTFYTHFTSIDELAERILIDALDPAVAADVAWRRAHDDDRAAHSAVSAAAIVDALSARREIFVWVMRRSSTAASTLVAALAERFSEIVRVERPDALPVQVAAGGDYLAAGLLYAASQWFAAGHPHADDAELAAELRFLAPSWLVS